MNKDLISYYHQRAKEYERIYQKPERQEDLKILHQLLSSAFPSQDVLEIGCGTGYWTPSLAKSVASILATDINESVLDIARSKSYPTENVQFMQMDMYNLPSEIQGKYSAFFAGFVWSHVKKADLSALLQSIHACLQPGSKVMWVDNQYVEGSNRPITYTDEGGNTYQSRNLDDGSEHLVLKNFPTDEECLELLDGMAENISIQRLEYYWVLRYEV
ncbi:MAG: class I SAM-dependent methyltransferase [Bacteroidota bacterium]